MEQLNRRKKMMVLDIETLNSTEDALSYDVGFAVTDKKGHIYEEHSFIIYDMFFEEKELMQSAYYAKKIPEYLDGIKKGNHKVVTFMTAWRIIRQVMEKYGIKEVYAYNAAFDYGGLNRTLRYISKSKYRWFFPYGTKIFCIWHMACQVLFTQKTFWKVALANGWVTKSGNFQTSAEIAYRYMTGQKEFDEEHKGLDDVRIEVQILLKCIRQHKKMNPWINRSCWRIPTQEYKKFQQSKLYEELFGNMVDSPEVM